MLTLDQDSVVAANMVEVYRHELQGKERLAMLTCDIVDRNANTRKQLNQPQVDGFVPRCITSGCLLNVEAWRSVGGFDESLFIDCVDHEICDHLIKDGWTIYRTFGTHILHELGHRRVVKVLGHEFLTNNHAPFRHYYIARNRIVVARRYGKLLRELYHMVKDFCKLWLFERQRCEKTKNIVRGLRDAFLRPPARYDPSKSGQPPDG